MLRLLKIHPFPPLLVLRVPTTLRCSLCTIAVCVHLACCALPFKYQCTMYALSLQLIYGLDGVQ